MNTYLFTYGTLMRKFNNCHAKMLQENARYIGQASIPGYLYLVDLYPGAILDSSSENKIYGEVYQILDARIWSDLDDYEDVGADCTSNLYQRKQKEVTMEGNQLLTCWMYLYNLSTSGLPLISSGNFLDIRAAK